MMSRPSNRDAIYAAFVRGDSPATIVADLGITKQAVSVWKQKWEREKVNAVNASIDQSTAQFHGSTVNPHLTSPEPMSTGERKADRPPTWAEKTAIVVEAIVRGGVSRTAAYSIAGIPPSSGRSAFNRDEKFRAAILEAEARLEMGPAKNLLELAMGKQQGANISAAIFLSRRFPASWAERRQLDIDVSGRIEHVDIKVLLSQGTPEQIERRIDLIGELESELQAAEARQLPEHAVDADFHEVESHES